MKYDQCSDARSSCFSEISSQAEIKQTSGMPALTFDPNDYTNYVREYHLNEQQQGELLEAIWSIVVGFVDLGYRIHPIQQALDSAKLLETDSPSVLASEQNSQIADETAASLEGAVGQEDS